MGVKFQVDKEKRLCEGKYRFMNKSWIREEGETGGEGPKCFVILS